MSGRAKTAREVTNRLKEDMGVFVSVKTVTRALNQAGLASAEKKKKTNVITGKYQSSFGVCKGAHGLDG